MRDLSVVIADDHAIVREGIASFLSARRPLTVAAHCSEGEEALREILEQRPDIAILDFNLPRLPTMEVIRRVRLAGCGTPLIVLLTSHDSHSAAALFQCGASACLLKDGPASELPEAVEIALRGGQFLSQGLKLSEPPAEGSFPDPMQVLSRREYEVFARLAEGVRPRDIAKSLQISPKTVDTYRANILKKLNVEGVAGLIRFALEHRVTPLPLSDQ